MDGSVSVEGLREGCRSLKVITHLGTFPEVRVLFDGRAITARRYVSCRLPKKKTRLTVATRAKVSSKKEGEGERKRDSPSLVSHVVILSFWGTVSKFEGHERRSSCWSSGLPGEPPIDHGLARHWHRVRTRVMIESISA